MLISVIVGSTDGGKSENKQQLKEDADDVNNWSLCLWWTWTPWLRPPRSSPRPPLLLLHRRARSAGDRNSKITASTKILMTAELRGSGAPPASCPSRGARWMAEQSAGNTEAVTGKSSLVRRRRERKRGRWGGVAVVRSTSAWNWVPIPWYLSVPLVVVASHPVWQFSIVHPRFVIRRILQRPPRVLLRAQD